PISRSIRSCRAVTMSTGDCEQSPPDGLAGDFLVPLNRTTAACRLFDCSGGVPLVGVGQSRSVESHLTPVRGARLPRSDAQPQPGAGGQEFHGVVGAYGSPHRVVPEDLQRFARSGRSAHAEGSGTARDADQHARRRLGRCPPVAAGARARGGSRWRRGGRPCCSTAWTAGGGGCPAGARPRRSWRARPRAGLTGGREGTRGAAVADFFPILQKMLNFEGNASTVGRVELVEH